MAVHVEVSSNRATTSLPWSIPAGTIANQLGVDQATGLSDARVAELLAAGGRA